jgi:hypothetical protein
MAFPRGYHSLPVEHKVLHLSGIPVAYLKKNCSKESFKFLPVGISIPNNQIFLSLQEQSLMFSTLLEKIDQIGSPILYGVGSSPVDQAAVSFGSFLSKAYYENSLERKIYPKVKWIDVGTPDWSFKSEGDQPDLLVVYGLSEKSDPRKLEIAKDFIRHFDISTKLVLAETSNILSYMINNLGMFPQAVWQLDSLVFKTLA